MKAKDNKDKEEIRSFLEKIVINAGIGRVSGAQNFEDKVLPQIKKEIALIAGQMPQVRRAKKSIAGFKVREGQIVGLRVTLRGRKMVDFFERLITIVLPRVRDFAGIAEKNVDSGGALSIGFREQYVFPEIVPEESPYTFSLEVTAVPWRKKREAALEEYYKLGVPLKK